MTYADSLVEITDDALILRRYYFPFGAPRRLRLSEISGIASVTPTLFNGRWRIWGSATFRTWFPLDWKRPLRDKIFLVTLRGRWRRVGFTVEDSRRVEGLLKENGLLTV
jgi:hypothetical protein